jgi:Ca2+-transporting ATPase
VYARVDPAQKIRVVEALQRRGEFVAVTGDGVNDAPALRQGDIGVAMGRGGTDVAREAADLVLLDDNFATIVAAVREGRRIYDNLRKVIAYVMTGNWAEILAIFLAPFLGMPLPLQPVQILWVNLLTDGLPALALTTEREEADIMRRPPRPPGESVFAGAVWQRVVVMGWLIAGLCLVVQAYGIANDMAHWQTMVFTVLTFSQALLALAFRSDRESIFAIGILSNPAMVGSVLLVVSLQLAIIYLPTLQPVFGTSALSLGELAVCSSAALLVLAVVEGWKAARRWFPLGASRLAAERTV